MELQLENPLDESVEVSETDMEEANAAAEIDEALADVPEPSNTCNHSNVIAFEGKSLYKVTVVKEYFRGDNYGLASTDRAKRVRGYSRFCGNHKMSEEQLDLDDRRFCCRQGYH